MKLFHSPGACSLAPIILAEWLDLPLELQRVNLKQPSDEFKAINPLGAVPALQVDSGRVFTQADAILQYFLDLCPDSGLGAGDDPLDRFELHRWNAFLTGDYHPAFGGWFNPARFTTDDSDAARAAVKAGFEKRIKTVANVLDEQVGESGHIALGRRTVLDAYAFAMLRWLEMLDGGLAAFPNLQALMQALAQDEGVQKALAREKA